MPLPIFWALLIPSVDAPPERNSHPGYANLPRIDPVRVRLAYEKGSAQARARASFERSRVARGYVRCPGPCPGPVNDRPVGLFLAWAKASGQATARLNF